MIKRIPNMDFNPGQLINSIHTIQEVRKPKKMATPPIEGVNRVWILLCPGISRIFFFSVYLIRIGKISTATVKEVSVDPTIEIMNVANVRI
jgi:hypothetical protein